MSGPTCGASGEAFPKTMRLLARHEFLRAKSRARKVHTDHLIALALPSRTGVTRVGLTVSTKVGNSVERNQVKRWLREIFRKNRAALPPAIDLVLIGKRGAPTAGHRRLEAEFLEVARRLAQPAGGAPSRRAER